MPRNKVLEKAKVTIPSGRNAFDESQTRHFTSLLGEIDIAYCQRFVAGSDGHISRETITRTADIVSPCFHNVTEHFDFFVVPIHSLWRYWENWKLNMNDMHDTSMLRLDDGEPDLTLPLNAPRLNFRAIIHTLGYDTPTGDPDEDVKLCRKANDVLRFMDELRYSDRIAPQTETTTARTMNVFALAAYQKCYYEHYRNTAYESNNPYAFNFDWMYSDQYVNNVGLLNPSGSGIGVKHDYVVKQLFTRRRVNYRNDFFHNVYPSLNYVVSSPSGTDWQLPNGVGQLNVSANNLNVFNPGTVVGLGSARGASAGTIDVTNGGVKVGSVLNSQSVGISVQTIRAAFAMDKLMRAAAYAPKHVRDQYKALYGVEGVEDYDMVSARVGSFQSGVAFQEVVNMADGAKPLGAIGAKGLGMETGSKPIHFHCKYDSIVIGLHYFMPRASYDNHGIDVHNVKIAREDFYIKAFENLGLRPLYGYELSSAYSVDGGNGIIGWTVPNHEYKILPDLNCGPFREEFQEYFMNEDSEQEMRSTTSELSTFVPHTLSGLKLFTLSDVPIDANYFKVSPEDMDNVFAVKVPSYHPISYYQFYGIRTIKVAAVLPMSVHGQPSL